MAEILIFDTTFLIDVQREHQRDDRTGPAHAFLQAHGKSLMQLPITALGEFAEGFSDPHHAVLEAVLQQFELLPIGPATALAYARMTRELRAEGRLIGTNDLWIAATAVAAGHPLVTRNTAEFGRIHGLRLLGY